MSILVEKNNKNNILSLYLRVIRKGAINSFNKTRKKNGKKRKEQ